MSDKFSKMVYEYCTIKSFLRQSKSLFKKLKNKRWEYYFCEYASNVFVVLQCRQITFKGERAKYFEKGPLCIINIIVIAMIIIQLLLLPFLLTTMME